MRTIDIPYALFQRHISSNRPVPKVVQKLRRDYRIDLDCPNADALFETVAEIYLGLGLDLRLQADKGVKKSATRILPELKMALFGDDTI